MAGDTEHQGSDATGAPEVRLGVVRFRRPTIEGESRPLRVAGWSARLHVWTEREYSLLKHPPSDAVRFRQAGVWVALRFD